MRLGDSLFEAVNTGNSEARERVQKEIEGLSKTRLGNQEIVYAVKKLARAGKPSEAIAILEREPVENWRADFRAAYIFILRRSGKSEEAQSLLAGEVDPEVHLFCQDFQPLLETIESQSRNIQIRVADALWPTNPEETLRIGRLIMSGQPNLENIRWFIRRLKSMKRWDEIVETLDSVLERQSSDDFCWYVLHFMSGTLLQHKRDAGPRLLRLLKRMLSAAPRTRKLCEDFGYSMLEKGLGAEAREILTLCIEVSDQDVLRSKLKENRKKGARNQNRKKERIGAPELIEKDLTKAEEHRSKGNFSAAMDAYLPSLPIASQTKPSTLVQWEALTLFAECALLCGRLEHLREMLDTYEKRELITKRFRKRLERHVAIATASKDELPEAEIGEHYFEYSRSPAFRKLAEGSVPKSIEGQSRKDIAVLKNVDLTLINTPRPKRHP